MDFVICAGGNSRCVEGEYNGRIGGRRSRIQVSRGIFVNFEEIIWGWRKKICESGRTKKVGTGREDNGGIHAGVQEGSKRKWI